MDTIVIQNWTESRVPIKGNEPQDVRYRVYSRGEKLYQDIRNLEGERLHTLELPDRMVLEKSSYEVLLRYALTDDLAA